MADMTVLMCRNTMELSSERKLRRISASSSFISELHMVKEVKRFINMVLLLILLTQNICLKVLLFVPLPA